MKFECLRVSDTSIYDKIKIPAPYFLVPTLSCECLEAEKRERWANADIQVVVTSEKEWVLHKFERETLRTLEIHSSCSPPMCIKESQN